MPPIVNAALTEDSNTPDAPVGRKVRPNDSIACHFAVAVETSRPVEFVDITGDLARVVQESGLTDGLLVAQTRHTTTGLLINEHEPLLLADLEAMFERIAPGTGVYAHDDFARRTVNLAPGERRNGWAHCRAALLRTSESVPVKDGRLTLGRWQRLFLVEFDGGQRREVSVWLTGRRGEPSRSGSPRYSIRRSRVMGAGRGCARRTR